jgi:hypothetical protein
VNVGVEMVPVSVAGVPENVSPLIDPEGVNEVVEPPTDVIAVVARATGVNVPLVSATAAPVNVAPLIDPAGV